MVNPSVLSRIALASLTSLALFAGGCTSKTPEDEADPSAITNRPQSYDRFIAILKLKSPALLASAKRVDGAVVIDQAQKTAILAEQNALIAELQALSPDIKVLYRYEMVLNALAVVGPRALEEKFRQLGSVAYVEREQEFARLAPVDVRAHVGSALEALEAANSVSFIGAKRVHDELGFKGEGIKVGVIDTGIDYTHAMFGGAGTEDAFKNNNPDTAADGGYPNAKVVGGIDLVGTAFNSASPNFEQHVPKQDDDPIDEGGHGTHVAGTIAGLGNATDTYSGVAPEASLYAIKVFGADGSTGDAVVIQSLEYAAVQKLDVVNLSLGSLWGVPHILYTEAVSNLVKGDTVVVASAGNSGENANIVGAPSTSDDALSVAASVDNMPHNWQFRGVLFKLPGGGELLAEAVEAAFGKPIDQAGNVTGKLVHLGTAAVDLTPEQKAAVLGNVALIDRGAVPFSDKARRAAEAGAIGVVIANNQPGDPFVMGGDGSYEIPAIMISQTLGATIKAALPNGDAIVQFETAQRIEKPELIDTLTSFSSRGPRSIDGAIKPEISAPGMAVISAAMGSGTKGVKFSGTSMAAPHMSGVMALLAQAKPNATALQLKSLAIETAKSITDKTGVVYPVAFAGAGRVQAYEAAIAAIVAAPGALSFGEVLVETSKVIRKELKLTNTGTEPKTLTLTTELDAGLTATLPSSLTLAPGETQTVSIALKITPPTTNDASLELDGFVKIAGDTSPIRVPLLAVVNRTTRVAAKKLEIQATSAADAAGAATTLTVKNDGKNKGEALVFNLLGTDGRKEAARTNPARNGICDLESVGWRTVKTTVEGVEIDTLQIAAKLYNPVTSWHVCEISVQIDGNGDGVADQELLGTTLYFLQDDARLINEQHSFLTNGDAMRAIRRDYEQRFPEVAAADYGPAIEDMLPFQHYAHSTIAVVSADLAKVAKTPSGDLKVKIAVLADWTTPDADDFLGNDAAKWRTLSPATGQAYLGMPEKVELAAGEVKTVDLTKGTARGDLVVYFPFNQSTLANTGHDAQSKVVKPKYAFD